MQTSNISRSFVLSQDGKPIEIVEPGGDCHLQERGHDLIVYVPMAKKAQNFCFGSPLPRRLADWLMTDAMTVIADNVDDALLALLTTLLNVDRAVIPSVLDYGGVVKVPVLDETSHELGEDAADDENTEDGDDHEQPIKEKDVGTHLSSRDEESNFGEVDAIASELRRASSRSSTPGTSSFSNTVSTLATANLSAGPRPTISMHNQWLQPSTSRDQVPFEADELRYRGVLERVVDCARRSTFPPQGLGAFDVSALLDPVLPDAVYSWPTATERVSRLERDKKVGAAGELYVSAPCPHPRSDASTQTLARRS